MAFEAEDNAAGFSQAPGSFPPSAANGAPGVSSAHYQPGAPPEPPEIKLLSELAEMPNAAKHPSIKEEALTALAGNVIDGYKRDLASRSEWEETAERAMKAAEQARQGKNFPFPNAANVRYPLVAIAALQFNARAYPAICSGQEIVRAKIGGADPQGEKANRKSRVQQFMSHQIVDDIQAWESEMDTALYQAPIIGGFFKKTYWDHERDEVESQLVSAFDLVVNEKTRCLTKCPRISHCFQLYPYEIEAKERAGIYLKTSLLDQESTSEDEQAPIDIIEQHCYADMDGDDFAEPWIATVSLQSQTLLRLVAGFDPLDIVHDGRQIVRIPRTEYFTGFKFLPNPKGGFYGIGFGHLLDSFSEVINSSFNQMLDAGSLQNAGGGIAGAGLDLQSDSEEFRMEPGKWWFSTSEAEDIRKNFMPFEHAGPSPVMFQLLGMMMEDAKSMVSVQDILTGGMGANTMAPTTMMGLIEQGMQVFTAIYQRIFNGLTDEFRIIYNLNRKYLNDDVYQAYIGQSGPEQQQPQMPVGPGAPPPPQGAPAQNVPVGPAYTVAADFADDKCLVTPVADPKKVSRMLRLAKAQFTEQLAQNPLFQPLMNTQEVFQRIVEAAELDDPMKLIKPPAPPTPIDQLNVQKLQAEVESLNAAAAHNTALADAESARGEHFRAKTAEIIANQQPGILKNP